MTRRQRSIFRDDEYAAIGVDGKTNWKNRSVFVGDCLDVMRQMNSGSVHLIYLDPPFNKKKQFQAPIGSPSEGGGFKDFWDWGDIHPYEADELEKHYPAAARVVQAARLTSNKGMAAYCLMMASRLIEMRRVLKPTGTLYLHCDATASHYLKLLLDAIFGSKNFLGDISWNKRNGVKARTAWGNENDNILCYAKKKKGHTFNHDDPTCRVPFADTSLSMHFQNEDKSGRKYRLKTVNGKTYRYYADEGRFIGNLWNDIPSMSSNSPIRAESTRYPTQKPLPLLERIVRASSNEGDVVLDPFCGCATTLLAAEKLNRNYCGIDIADLAGKLLKKRLNDATKQGELGKGIAPLPNIIKAQPARSDTEKAMTARDKTEHKKYLFGDQSGKCAGCGNTFLAPNQLALDRIVPGANGGVYVKRNLQLLCHSCNSIKGDRPHEYLTMRLTQLGYIE